LLICPIYKTHPEYNSPRILGPYVNSTH
jgi:hypothetical protein